MATIGAVSSMRELRESVRASNLDHAVDAMKMVRLYIFLLCYYVFLLVSCFIVAVGGGCKETDR